jgi:thioredoxin 1
MNRAIKITIVVVIVLSILGIFIFKSNEKSQIDKEIVSNNDTTIFGSEINLPTLVEFGSKTCEPCKTMIPILQKIKNDYKDKLVVSSIDVYEDSTNTMKYNIRVTPTLIFFDSKGKVIYRCEGVLYENEIVEKLVEMGIK